MTLTGRALLSSLILGAAVGNTVAGVDGALAATLCVLLGFGIHRLTH